MSLRVCVRVHTVFLLHWFHTLFMVFAPSWFYRPLPAPPPPDHNRRHTPAAPANPPTSTPTSSSSESPAFYGITISCPLVAFNDLQMRSRLVLVGSACKFFCIFLVRRLLCRRSLMQCKTPHVQNQKCLFGCHGLCSHAED